MVTILATGDTTELIMAKLTLEAEGIPFMTQGEGVQDLFGIGRMFSGFNPITGPVEIRVTEADAERARAALATLTEEG